MVMVRSGRKTAEVSVIWWLLILLPQPPPSNKLELPPLWLCTGVSAEARCLPEISLPVSGRTGCTGQFLFPEGRGDCLPKQFSGDGDGWLVFEPSGPSLWGPSQKVPFCGGGSADLCIVNLQVGVR